MVKVILSDCFLYVYIRYEYKFGIAITNPHVIQGKRTRFADEFWDLMLFDLFSLKSCPWHKHLAIGLGDVEFKIKTRENYDSNLISNLWRLWRNNHSVFKGNLMEQNAMDHSLHARSARFTFRRGVWGQL